MSEHVGLEMVSRFNQYLSESDQASLVAFAEDLTPDLLLDWLAEREAWNFKASTAGTQDGFILLNIGGTRFAMGVFCHMTGKPSFAVFFMTSPGPRPADALAVIERVIAGGSILTDRLEVSKYSKPSQISNTLSLGHGYPISG